MRGRRRELGMGKRKFERGKRRMRKREGSDDDNNDDIDCFYRKWSAVLAID